MSSFLGAISAIQHRLMGKSPAFVAPYPLLGDNLSSQLFAPGTAVVAAGTGVLHVPLHWYGTAGRPWTETMPSLTWNILATKPRRDETSAFANQRRRITIQDSARPTDDEDEATPRLAWQRDFSMPYDIMFEIRCYAADPITLAFLEAYVYRQFGDRGFLRVPTSATFWASWDTAWQDSNDLDQRAAVRAVAPGVEREEAKALTWNLEGYLTNDDLVSLVHFVERTRLNLHTKE